MLDEKEAKELKNLISEHAGRVLYVANVPTKMANDAFFIDVNCFFDKVFKRQEVSHAKS